MRILGIDPGYDRVGIAIVEKIPGKKETLVYSACFQTSSKDSFFTRLFQVGQEIQKIVGEYKPGALAIESLFITKNQKTAMKVSESRGVIIYEAMRENIPVFEYTPPQIKMAVTGDGSSDKHQIMKMIPLLIKFPSEKYIKEAIDDEFDAIAVALTCIATESKSFPQKE